MEKTIEELTAKAEEFVRAKGFNGLVDHTLVKNWMAEFAVDHARDAVQDLRNESDTYFEQLKAERTKVAELEKQNKKLQWLLDGEISAGEQRTAMQIIPIMREAAKDELIGKLQAKSTALVEALEFVKQRCEDLETGCEPVYEIVNGKEGARLKGQFTVITGSDYEVVCNALEAHKKGGNNA